jgi:hypothetical protein
VLQPKEEPVARLVQVAQAVQAVRLKAVKVAQAAREVWLQAAPAGPEAVCFRAVVVADRSLALP